MHYNNLSCASAGDNASRLPSLTAGAANTIQTTPLPPQQNKKAAQRAASLSLPRPPSTAAPPPLPHRLCAPQRSNGKVVSPKILSLSSSSTFTSTAFPAPSTRRCDTPNPFQNVTARQRSHNTNATRATTLLPANATEKRASNSYSTGRLRASVRRSLTSAALSSSTSTSTATTTAASSPEAAAAVTSVRKISESCALPGNFPHVPTTTTITTPHTSFTALRLGSSSTPNTATPVLSHRPSPFENSARLTSPLDTSSSSASPFFTPEAPPHHPPLRQLRRHRSRREEVDEGTFPTQRSSLEDKRETHTPVIACSPTSQCSCASSKSDFVLLPREVDVTQVHAGEGEEKDEDDDVHSGEGASMTQAPQPAQYPGDTPTTSTTTHHKTSAAAASPSVAQLLRAFLAEHAPAPPAPHADHTSSTTDAEAQTCLTQVEMEQLYAMLRDQHHTPPPPATTTTTATPTTKTTSSDAPTSHSMSTLPLPQWVVDDSDATAQMDTTTATRVSSTRTQRTPSITNTNNSSSNGTVKAGASAMTASTNFSITLTGGAASSAAAHKRRAQFPAVVFLSEEALPSANGGHHKDESEEEDPAAVSDFRQNGFSVSSYFSSSSPSHLNISDDDKPVEVRYKEALKTIEEAASDCAVALHRIQDYSESLSVLVETWMHLHDNRFEEFAIAVVDRLLDNTPSYRLLFVNIDLHATSLAVMDMIGRAVVAFTRPADLMDIMGEMGARHNLYGLHTEDFTAMRTAFLQVYGEFVGPETYAKSVGVWKMFWKTTIEFAGSGAKSERGKVYTERRYRIWAERVKKVVRHLLPRQRSGGFHRLMQLTYQRACEQHPRAMQPYHQLADLRTAHRTMEAFMRIVKRVVYAETAPVVGYNEQFSIDHLLTDLASAVAPHDVALMADAFLDACESYTQPALWDEVVRAALRELWLVYVVGYWTARRERVADGAAQEAAPSGREPFCLLFTDIEASTRLWDADPRAMGAAISRHHQVVRGLIEDFGGYEVKTVGDSFLVATNTVTQALLIAFGIQLELMTEPSAPGFRMVDSPQGGGDASCWRGDALRVRVGIHYCTDASAVYDSVHGRFDYYGPSVNCASRVESSACGGQVLLSEDAYAHLRQEDAFAALPANRLYVEQVGKLVRAQEARGVAVARDPQLSWIVEAVERDRAAKTVRRASSSAHAAAASLRNTHVHSAQLQRRNSRGEVMTLQSLTTATDEGLHPLKGIAEPVRLFSLLPLGLTGREFPQMRRTHRHLSESGAGSSFTALFSSTGGLSEGSVNGSAFNSAVRSSEQRSPAQ